MTTTSEGRRRLRAWLVAEATGRSAEAEAALRQLLGLLPQPAPPAGLADRVLLRTGRLAPRLERWALALLLLASASLSLLPSWLPAVAVRLRWDALVHGCGELLLLAGRWIVRVAGLWEVAAVPGRVVLLVLQTPVGAGAAVAGWLLVLALTRLLHDLLLEGHDYARA